MSVRGKNKKERLGGFFKSITKTADEVLISGQKVSSKEGLSQRCEFFVNPTLLPDRNVYL